jgi:uncharacterized repeat protein (TIGR01451 family)
MVSSESSILPQGGEGEIVVSATNVGDAPVNGATTPVTVTDTLPLGMTSTGASAIAGQDGEYGETTCSGSTVVTCTFATTPKLPAYSRVEVTITVAVAADAHSGEDEVTVTGGEAPDATFKQLLDVGSEPTPFGIEHYELAPENEGGSLDTQAGSHPFQLTATLALNNKLELLFGFLPVPAPPELPKDLHFNLPPGLIGNPTQFPQCSDTAFAHPSGLGNLCAADTQIGVVSVTLFLPPTPIPLTFARPLYNMVPSTGEPARFGFLASNVPVILNTSLRTGGDYGVTVNVENTSEDVSFTNSVVTFWGTPGDPRHDDSRGTSCVTEDKECPTGGEAGTPPLLTLPSSCTGPLQTSVQVDSWTHPEELLAPVKPLSTESLDGCNRLPFNPEVKVTPDGTAASTPTGLTVDEHVPQEPTLNPEGDAESDVKGLSVTLPEGVTLNPAAADGLEACSLAQIGLESSEAALCPDASKVATVTIRTPLLPDPLEGAAYVAAQDANPFGSLVAMYIFAEDPTAGVRAKAAGQVVENLETGQLTAHFERDPLFEGKSEATQFLPELPFEDVELHFFGGERAPLSTPPRCGGYTTRGTFTPWSGGKSIESSSEFKITTGPNDSPCPNPLPFAPSLTGGTTSVQAGGFSPLTMTMSRADGNQNLKGIQLQMPPGLLGTLSSVKLCEEPQADAGTCGPESLIGHTTVSVGLGADPYTVTGGEVFITGPYGGAPYGLSIVVPTVAGPFTLEGNTGRDREVVRAKIEVNPRTAALTVTTDASGKYEIPQILKGIPLQIKHVNVTVDRSRFTFNPTDCNPLAITSTLFSAEGATAALSVPFQVGDCAALAFKPKFALSTSAHTSRTGGASLDVKLTYPNTPPGSEANIAKVKVQLPKRLPSRLTTLQKACTEAVFDANPAGCPAASMVGQATAKTPVLPTPLNGPAYFVSHGGAKFPELIVVLQGDNVTVQLHGETFISKKGITTSTFNTVPDVPVSSFELNLPKGTFSALTTLGNPCKGTLTVPTEFVAQDGAKINQKTKITVTGCPKKVNHSTTNRRRRKK